MSRKKWRSVMIVGILAALTAALMSSATAGAAPKAGPTVIVGSKNFTEEYILGELYSQALKAKGFSVKYKQSIGATEVIDTALTSGKINIYPEYVGEIDQTVFHQTTLPKTAQGLVAARREAEQEQRGITVLNPTPFFDVDAIAVRKADAQKYGLKTVADLKKVPNASVGARPEFKDREEGFKGMQDVYGLTKMKYVSLDQGLTYQALDQKKVFVDRRLLDRPAARKRQVRRPQGPEAHLRRAERRTRGVEQAADGPRLEGGALQVDRERGQREAVAGGDPRDELARS